MRPEDDEWMHMMKRIELQDARTGRVLCFAMHPTKEAVRVDETFVERKPSLEVHAEEIVFGPAHTDEAGLVYLDKSHVNRARKLWGMPEM